MRYDFQDGPLVSAADFDLSVDAEISYLGIWRSLNDHRRYRLATEGFGRHDQTFTRKTVKSGFYSGDYTVRSTKDATKRTWAVLVNGVDQTDLEEALVDLTENWFGQDFYNVRVKKNEYVETWLCDKADYSVDASHVYLHNCKALVSLNFAVHPTVTREVLL